MKKMTVTFWCFIGVMAFCLSALLLKTIAVHTESEHNRLHLNTANNVWIDNVATGSDGYNTVVPLESVQPDLTAEAHVVSYNLNLRSDNPKALTNNYLRWSIVFDYLNIACIVLTYVLGILCAIALYRNIKREKTVKTQYISYLWWIGLILIISVVFMLVRDLLQSLGVQQLVPDTAYTPHVNVTIEVSQIIFGIVILFLSQILRITHKLQEEQELTI